MADKSDVKLKCIYGNVVTIKNLTTSQESSYTLVNYGLEKLDQNRISNYTPIGRAIWAKHEGDEVLINGQAHRITKIVNE